MNQLKTFGPMAIALVALVLVVLQRSEVSDLQDQLGASQRALKTQKAPRTERVKVATSKVEFRTDSALLDRLSRLENKLQAVGALARTASKKVLAASVTDTLVGDSELPDFADELASLRDDVDALLQGRGVESPEAKATIEKAIDTAHDVRRKERDARRTERRREAIDAFIAEQELPAATADRIREISAASNERRSAVREAVRAGDKTREEARAEMRAARDEDDAELAELLTEEQFETYKESTRRGRGGPGGRGGRGG